MPGLPPPAHGELGTLLAYLAHNRHLVKVAAHGLDDEQLRATPSASSLSVGGIVKHLAVVERNWLDTILERRGPSEYGAYAASFTLDADESFDDVLQRWDGVAHDVESTVRDIGDLDHPVPVPSGVPWYPQDLDAWTVRWVLLHLIEEIARHAGHADIVRESVDGATAIPLMAAAERWPPNDFITPWRPADPAQRG